jgi:hypothetical protein
VPQAPQGGGGLEAGARRRTTPVLGAHASRRWTLTAPREGLEDVRAHGQDCAVDGADAAFPQEES